MHVALLANILFLNVLYGITKEMVKVLTLSDLQTEISECDEWRSFNKVRSHAFKSMITMSPLVFMKK